MFPRCFPDQHVRLSSYAPSCVSDAACVPLHSALNHACVRRASLCAFFPLESCLTRHMMLRRCWLVFVVPRSAASEYHSLVIFSSAPHAYSSCIAWSAPHRVPIVRLRHAHAVPRSKCTLTCSLRSFNVDASFPPIPTSNCTQMSPRIHPNFFTACVNSPSCTLDPSFGSLAGLFILFYHAVHQPRPSYPLCIRPPLPSKVACAARSAISSLFSQLCYGLEPSVL